MRVVMRRRGNTVTVATLQPPNKFYVTAADLARRAINSRWQRLISFGTFHTLLCY